MAFPSRATLKLLRERRRGPLHVIDPYKVPVYEAAEKARAVAALGFPILLVGSTDYADFGQHMPPYLHALKRATDLRIVLHFPPRKGEGVPICEGADAVLRPCVLNSADDYFAGAGGRDGDAGAFGADEGPYPEVLSSAAFVIGPDSKSYQAVRALPLEESPLEMGRYASVIRANGFDIVYLYSRHARVSPAACRFFRENINPEQLLFVSGGVRSRAQVELYLTAGADYVVFGTALETGDWREVLDEIAAPSLSGLKG
jgi:heptaprenylglyceryl phosphate synthase